MIFIYFGSILVITWIFYFLRKFAPIKICAVCAGVAGTWILGLVARYFGYQVDESLLGMLMGGSVVGIMYQIDKRNGGGLRVFIKFLLLAAGFFAVYNLINYSFAGFISGVLAWIFVYAFLIPKPVGGLDRGTIEKRMVDHCCD